jgi:hypothetical protein
MELTLDRKQLDPGFTIGDLYVDGVWECFTCEDTVRAPGAPKVFGQTAIPAGRYEVVITPSPHFGRDLPLLVGVPGFDGVRIHPGNTAADTEGCVLVGRLRWPKGVGESKLAFEALFPKIQAAIAAGDKVFIEIA